MMFFSLISGLLDGEFNSNLEAYPEMNRYLGNPLG